MIVLIKSLFKKIKIKQIFLQGILLTCTVSSVFSQKIEYSDRGSWYEGITEITTDIHSRKIFDPDINIVNLTLGSPCYTFFQNEILHITSVAIQRPVIFKGTKLEIGYDYLMDGDLNPPAIVSSSLDEVIYHVNLFPQKFAVFSYFETDGKIWYVPVKCDSELKPDLKKDSEKIVLIIQTEEIVTDLDWEFRKIENNECRGKVIDKGSVQHNDPWLKASFHHEPLEIVTNLDLVNTCLIIKGKLKYESGRLGPSYYYFASK